jgi:hypothetical protein
VDDDRSIPEEMVDELGIDPAAGVDDRQRFELLREWHRRDAERDEEQKERGKKREGPR